MKSFPWLEARYRRRKDEGLCVNCGSVDIKEDSLSCEGCLRRMRLSARALRKDRQAKGLCNCGGVRVDGYKECARCRAYTKSRKRGRNVTHERLRASGLCIYNCGNVAQDNRVSCLECRREIQRKRKVV